MKEAQCIIDLYQCKLGQKYISPIADIVQYPHFEAGVVNIQKGIENQMNGSKLVQASGSYFLV